MCNSSLLDEQGNFSSFCEVWARCSWSEQKSPGCVCSDRHFSWLLSQVKASNNVWNHQTGIWLTVVPSLEFCCHCANIDAGPTVQGLVWKDSDAHSDTRNNWFSLNWGPDLGKAACSTKIPPSHLPVEKRILKACAFYSSSPVVITSLLISDGLNLRPSFYWI